MKIFLITLTSLCSLLQKEAIAMEMETDEPTLQRIPALDLNGCSSPKDYNQNSGRSVTSSSTEHGISAESSHIGTPPENRMMDASMVNDNAQNQLDNVLGHLNEPARLLMGASSGFFPDHVLTEEGVNTFRQGTPLEQQLWLAEVQNKKSSIIGQEEHLQSKLQKLTKQRHQLEYAEQKMEEAQLKKTAQNPAPSAHTASAELNYVV